MEKKLLYVILCHSKVIKGCGEDYSTLQRICPTLDEAQALLQDLYDRSSKQGGHHAEHGFVYYNPEWLDGNKYLKLRVKMQANSYIGYAEDCTYEIHDEWEHNIFSTKSWLI